MRRLTLLPVAVIIAVLAVFVVNAAARSENNDSSSTVRTSSSAPELTLAATVADRLAEDGDEDAPADDDHRVINLFDGAGVPGSFVWNGDDKMSELIDELVKSGDLSAAGADKLREAMKHHNIFTIGEPGEGLFGNVEGNRGLNLFFSPDGDMAQHEFRVLGAEDGKQLKIQIEDDGSVTVEGEGYTDEELDEIRRQVEQDHKDGKPISIIGVPGAPLGMKWHGMTGDDSFALAVPDFGGTWTDENGEFRFREFNEAFPAPHSFSWESEDGSVAPHMFMFRKDDAELREQIEQMVREILEEMGIDPDTRTKVSSTSA
ncbi:hypothetical protein KDL29_08620 [bacterium]|nr:hypothetical protein [bacterium]UNM07446.1 MAG: hypothetical protein H7A35_11295 [Planctomycetales bacterium]